MPNSPPFGSQGSNAAVRCEPKLDLGIGVSYSGPGPHY